MTPTADYAERMAIIYNNGPVYGYVKTNEGESITPVLYLKSNINIIGGTGTSTDPFRINLGVTYEE